MVTKAKAVLTNKSYWGYGLFWSWNAIFLAFMLLGFAPTVLPELLTAVESGMVPPEFLVYGSILTLIPVLCVILGATLLRREPGKLFVLGYAVEGPLMLILAFRFFVVRQATTPVTIIMVVAACGIAALLWDLLDKRIAERGPVAAHVRVIGLTLLVAMGLYASVWVAFYAVPLAVIMLEAIWHILGDLLTVLRDIWDGFWELIRDGWMYVPFAVLGSLLFVYTATLVVLMPIAVPVITVRAWWCSVQGLAEHYSRGRAVALSVAVMVVCVTAVWLTNQQPQQTAFALLEEPPVNIAEAGELLEQEEVIRRGLLNAYLAPQRYISSLGDVNHVSDLYAEAFNITSEQAKPFQTAYEQVASPVLYQPFDYRESPNRWENRTLREEPAEAAQLYEQFFDQPINEGEKETVVDAMRSTWMVDQARAGWQAVDDREVYLTEQVITIDENGDWADVELYEVYENQTSQRQEVVYYFNLPESAVLTGVWLGNSADREERFTYRVAPRGAAQELYRNEVRRTVDPALLEQIGPRQYRLRIFPIPAQEWRWDDDRNRSDLLDAAPLHLWLTYRVMAEGQSWPLPQLAEQFNVYWDGETVRTVNGTRMDAGDAWLPEMVTAVGDTTPQPHRVDFPNGTTVIARPNDGAELPQPAGDLRLAVVLDRSRSMVPYADEVTAQLAEVAEWGTAVDVYLTSSPYRGEEPSRLDLLELNPETVVYYGGQNAAELLMQFAELQGDAAYDAVLVLTDSTGYKVEEGAYEPPIPNAPLWMVHVDGGFPLGYDDATLKAIQASGGGVAGSVDEALTRFMVWQQAGLAEGTADWVDGYLWLEIPTETADEMSAFVVEYAPTEPFADVAARRLLLAEMQRSKGDLSNLAVMDGLHALAVEHSIVSPYSSMIVLVEAAQERMLDDLEDDPDRFDREMEAVGETEGQVMVTGVPEPEEWLLIFLALGMFVWLARKQGRLAVVGLR
jgi:putative PEP-CTERM system integral membrane protein